MSTDLKLITYLKPILRSAHSTNIAGLVNAI